MKLPSFSYSILVGKFEYAVRASSTASYLMPGDEEMERNMEYYKSLGTVVDSDWFSPRQEAVLYVNRDNDEEALLTFIETEFTFNNNKDTGEKNQVEEKE